MRYSSKCLRQICRGLATPKILQRFYLFRGYDNSIALELEQVRKKLKNNFMRKSSLIWTLHLFYRHNTTCKTINTETAIHTLTWFPNWELLLNFNICFIKIFLFIYWAKLIDSAESLKLVLEMIIRKIPEEGPRCPHLVRFWRVAGTDRRKN